VDISDLFSIKNMLNRQTDVVNSFIGHQLRRKQDCRNVLSVSRMMLFMCMINVK